MKLDLNVPTSLIDIPLHQYQKFIETFDGNDDVNNEYAGLKMLEIFCGLKLNDALKVKVSDVALVTEKLNKALSEKPQLITRFTLGNTEFGFIPDLNDLTFGEFVDIENNITDWSNMHKAMAVLYRPVTQRLKNKYTIEDYRGDSWHSTMLNMPSAVVLSVITFFFHLENDLLKATLPYSSQKELEIQQAEHQISISNGDGITAL